MKSRDESNGRCCARKLRDDVYDVYKPLRKGSTIVSGERDIVKGRIKEAAGVLANNEKLQAEGKTDQAVGKVKQTAGKVVDAAKDAAKKTAKATKEVARKAADKAKGAAKSIRE
jgi:uncharacterized protein YjbJ (UPF0337 family)